MAQKYTILKVLIQSLSKERHSDKGFTLIELIVGMVILVSIIGLAMNAFISASSDFNKDKKTIDSSQSLSAVLEMIGSDIRQAGEQINDAKFPAIEFNTNTDTGSMPNSSKIIVRRALIGQLTLCDSTFTAASTTITVADNLKTTVDLSANCDVATSSSPLVVYRVIPAITVPPTSTTYYPTTSATALPSIPTPLTLKLPLALRNLRDYRCQLDNPNPTTPYDSTANAGTDFCGTPTAALETTRIAVANSTGQFLIFNQTNEIAPSGNTGDTVAKADTDTTSTKKYQIVVNTTFTSGDSATANNTKNGVATVTYPIGSPIYVIEERAYTLTTGGSLQVSVNGKTPETLVKKIDNFRVSARTYTNSKDKVVQSTPTSDVCSNAVPFSAQPTTATADNPKYICKFNYFTGVAATDNADWKTIAGIKVELRAKDDGTGQSTNDEKRSASAEFFPRNVLSK